MKLTTKLIIFSILVLTVSCTPDDDWNAFKKRLHDNLKVDTAATYAGYKGCCKYGYVFSTTPSTRNTEYTHVKDKAACDALTKQFSQVTFKDIEYFDTPDKCNVLRHCCAATAKDGTKFGYGAPAHLKDNEGCYKGDKPNGMSGLGSSCLKVVSKKLK